MDPSALGNPPIAILIVESNPADARLIAEAFSDAGVAGKIPHVDNGEDVISYLRREPPFQDTKRPDLILLDLNLPRKSGLEVLEEIRATESLSCIPVIILSGSGNPADIKNAYRTGANCYVRKPTGLDEFLELIKICHQFWGKTVSLPPGPEQN